MHRSRLSVLVILAAAAACSKGDDSDEMSILSQDSTLVARLEIDSQARVVALPAACGVVAVASKPAAVIQTEAKELTLQAQSSEIRGDIGEARSLLLRAVELDGTNKSAAYHLGRTNEALGDSTGATAAYCRYLALVPTTAESEEARQRVARLSPVETRVASGSIGESAPSRRRASAMVTRQVTRERQTSRSHVRDVQESPTQIEPVATSPNTDQTASSTNVADGTIATTQSAPTVDQPSAPTRAERRGPNRTQGAIVGAAAGAIIGAATGRSVKGAVIGAGAGGILGAIVGPTIRSGGRGTRS